MTTRVMTAHIPLELAEKVDRLAARDERPRGWIIKQALAAWVANEEERDNLTIEAMTQADAGLVVDHARVAAWARSLGSKSPQPMPAPLARR